MANCRLGLQEYNPHRFQSQPPSREARQRRIHCGRREWFRVQRYIHQQRQLAKIHFDSNMIMWCTKILGWCLQYRDRGSWWGWSLQAGRWGSILTQPPSPRSMSPGLRRKKICESSMTVSPVCTLYGHRERLKQTKKKQTHLWIKGDSGPRLYDHWERFNRDFIEGCWLWAAIW